MHHMDIYEIRRRNLERLIAEYGTIAELVAVVEQRTGAQTDANYISALRKPREGRRGMGANLARRLELGTKKAEGWMDRDHPEFDNIISLPGNIRNVSHVQTSLRQVPIISWVQAGQWNEAVDMFERGYAEEWQATKHRVSANAFALRVEGDSMEPEFPAGTIILVDPNREAENGDFVIAKVNGMATFKKLVIDAGKVYLKPVNPDYRMMELPEGGEIVGRVIAQEKTY